MRVPSRHASLVWASYCTRVLGSCECLPDTPLLCGHHIAHVCLDHASAFQTRLSCVGIILHTCAWIMRVPSRHASLVWASYCTHVLGPCECLPDTPLLCGHHIAHMCLDHASAFQTRLSCVGIILHTCAWTMRVPSR